MPGFCLLPSSFSGWPQRVQSARFTLCAGRLEHPPVEPAIVLRLQNCCSKLVNGLTLRLTLRFQPLRGPIVDLNLCFAAGTARRSVFRRLLLRTLFFQCFWCPKANCALSRLLLPDFERLCSYLLYFCR